MTHSKDVFIGLFLNMLKRYLEKDLGEKETENEMLVHSAEIIVERLKHIAESL